METRLERRKEPRNLEKARLFRQFSRRQLLLRHLQNSILSLQRSLALAQTKFGEPFLQMGSPEFFKNWSSRDSKYILLFLYITQMADDLLMAVLILGTSYVPKSEEGFREH